MPIQPQSESQCPCLRLAMKANVLFHDSNDIHIGTEIVVHGIRKRRLGLVRNALYMSPLQEC